MRRLLQLTFLFLLISGAIQAQNRYWRPASAANLNWNNTANWSTTPGGTGPASVPSFINGQTAIFDATNTLGCNLSTNTLGAGNLTITAGYTGTITQTNANFAFIVTGTVNIGGGTINMRPDGLGNITVAGNTTLSGGTINAQGGLQFDGNFFFNAPAVFTPGTSTVTFNGDNNGFASRTINVDGAGAGTFTLYNVILNKAEPGTQNLNVAAGDVLVVQNDLTLSAGSLGTGTGTVQVGGDLTIEDGFTGGIVDLVLNGTQNAAVIVDAPFKTAGNGTFTINKTNPASVVSFTTTLPSNNINLSTAASNGAFTVTSGTVTFPDNDAVSINYGLVDIAAAGTFTAPNNTLTLTGDLTVNGSFSPGTGTVVINGTAATNISIAGAPGTLNFNNLTINNTSGAGNVNLELGDIINVAGNLTIADGRFNVPGGSAANPSTIQVGGNLTTTSAAADATTAAVRLAFTGANPQTVSFFAGTEGIFNGPVSFEKSAAGPITLASPFLLDQANQTVAFTTGVISTAGANRLILGATTTSNDGSINSYVDGPMEKRGITAYTFPVGDAGVYAPLHISGGAAYASNLTGASKFYVAEYIRSSPLVPFPNTNNPPIEPPNSPISMSSTEYWRLDLVNEADFPTINDPAERPFVWLSYENTRSGGLTEPLDVNVMAWLGSLRYSNFGDAQATVNGNTYIGSELAAYTMFDINPVFTLGTIDPIANPLPVTWLDFTGRKVATSIVLDWSTTSELNNEKFTVERSSDGFKFNAIGVVPGNRTTSITSHYTFTDKYPLNGANVYRIKQTDTDGKYSYSAVIRVTNGEVTIKELRTYPNPVTGSTPLYLENAAWRNKDVRVTIVNAIGGVVRDQKVNFGTDSRATINVSGLAKGSYFVTTLVNGEKKVTRFIVQ